MNSMTVLIFVSFACMFLLMAGIMVAVFVFIIRTGIKRTQNVNQGWADFARRYHQSFRKAGFMTRPSVTGEYCQRSFVLDYFSIGQISGRVGTHRTYYTRITTQVKSDIDLKIERRGLLDNLFDTPEATDIDKSFSEKYKVNGDITPIETPATLDEIERNNLNALSIEDGKLTIYVRGFVHRPDVLRELYDLTCDIAELVEG